MLISSARLYVHKNVKINAYICIMYILVWPHNGVKSFLEEHSYFSESVFFVHFDVLTVSEKCSNVCDTPIAVMGSVWTTSAA